jgi:hypothetical protein
MVKSWWEEATKRRPIPDDLSCDSLAWKLEWCLNLVATAPSNKKSRQHSTHDALNFLSKRIPVAREYWESHTTAPLRDDALHWLAALEALLGPLAGEFLREDMVSTTFVNWESFVRAIYPVAAAAFEQAKGSVPDPHATCPVCVFLCKALSHGNLRQGNGVAITPGAISQFLRERSGLEMPSQRARRSRTSRDVDGPVAF